MICKKFQIDSLKIEVRTSSSDPDPKLIITDLSEKLPELIIMGGSHSTILASELTFQGYRFIDLSIPGWTPTAA